MSQSNSQTVLVLCTGNSCRSIMAEALINHLGSGRFKACSAGSQPTGQVHPQSLLTLERHGLSTGGYHSKSWDAFTDTHLDLVITVCDSAAAEVCPVFPGQPAKLHWSIPDPAHAQGTQQQIEAAFDAVFLQLQQRIQSELLQ